MNMPLLSRLAYYSSIKSMVPVNREFSHRCPNAQKTKGKTTCRCLPGIIEYMGVDLVLFTCIPPACHFAWAGLADAQYSLLRKQPNIYVGGCGFGTQALVGRIDIELALGAALIAFFVKQCHSTNSFFSLFGDCFSTVRSYKVHYAIIIGYFQALERINCVKVKLFDGVKICGRTVCRRTKVGAQGHSFHSGRARKLVLTFWSQDITPNAIRPAEGTTRLEAGV